jgi:hypothetical protein
MMKKVLFACLITSVLFGEIKAQQVSPIQKPLSSTANLTILGFEIEKSSLKEIRSKLGNAPRFKTSHNEEVEESMCYVSASDNMTVIEFRTGLPGRWKDLIGFRVSTLEYEPLRSKCSKSPVLDSIITESGLKLWMAKADIIARFGKPTSSSEEELIYRSEETRKPTPQELKAYKKAAPSMEPENIEIPVTTLMEFHFVSSKLVSFSTYRTETTEPQLLVRK